MIVIGKITVFYFFSFIKKTNFVCLIFAGEFYWLSDFGTNFVTSMHILVFASYRCFAVHCPNQLSIMTRKRVVVCISVLWMIAITTALPLFWLMGVIEDRGRNSVEFFY